MKVKELIEELQEFDPDMEVGLNSQEAPYGTTSSWMPQYYYDSVVDLTIREDTHGNVFLDIW